MASSTGKELERVVRAAGKRLTEKQQAKLWKIPNDLRITSSGECAWGDRLPCDFIGHTAHGRAILLECKQTRGTRLPVGPRGLKAHQFIALQEAHDAGAIALVIWARGKDVAAIPMDMLCHLLEGRKSIAWYSIPPRYVRTFTVEGVVELLEKHHAR